MRRQTAFLLFIFLISISSSLLAQSNQARIKFLIGKVQVQPAKKTNWERAKMNRKISSGDRIKTFMSARVELEMPDGSEIKINQNTVFDVKTIKTAARDNSDEMSFTLFAGSIWAKFKKIVNSRQSRQIESPSAVVAIRGTTIEMDVNLQKRTLVRVIEGRVSVRSKGVAGEVMVGSNQESTVDQGKAPTPARSSTTQDKRATLQGALRFDINSDKLQYTEAAILRSGIPIQGRVTPGALVFANDIPVNVKPNGLFNGRIPVQEGVNVIKLAARLNDENISKTLRVLVNTRKPELRLSSPLVAGFVNRRDYSLSGAVFDGTPQDKIKVFINKELIVELPGQGTFNRTIILNEGVNNIQLAALDFSKNRTVIAERLFLDTVKPIITVTEPAQPVFVRLEPPRPPNTNYDFTTEKFRQIIRGIIIDPAPSSGIKRILLNGKEVKHKSDGSFETEIVLTRATIKSIAENRLNFYVEDMAGNITRDNSRVIIIR